MEEARKQAMNEEMDEIKERIDKAKEEQKKKIDTIAQYLKEQKNNEAKIANSKLEKNLNLEEQKKLKKQLISAQEDLTTQNEQLKVR